MVVTVIFYEIRTVKFDAMEFVAKEGHIGRMMGAIFVSVYGINTMYLIYFLAFKWDVMLQTLGALNFGDSMYLNSTRKQVNKVLRYFIREK